MARRAWYNIILFVLSVLYVFLVGLLGEGGTKVLIYQLVISLIYIFSFMTIREGSGFTFTIPALMVVLTWVGYLFHVPLLARLTGVVATLFFFGVIVLLVMRIARSAKVQLLEFVESVNIYLLLGIAASILFKLVGELDSAAFHHAAGNVDDLSGYIYFAFVTMTTLGYGDISPASQAARSLAIFFSVAGQLYLTMIIAMLVGKYLGEKKE